MLRNSIWRSAIVIYVLTMLVFLLLQYFFKTQEFFKFSEFQYLLATSIANGFIITSIFALVAARNLIRWNSKPDITFFKIFKLNFFPGVIAGFMSLVSVFAYFHYVDPEGIEQIKTEYLDYSLMQVEGTEDYENIAEVINSPEIRETNLLSNRTFTLILGIVLFFTFSLSLMLSFLWKIRNPSVRI